MVEAMLSNRKKKPKSYLAEREYVESNKPESLARLCPETLEYASIHSVCHNEMYFGKVHCGSYLISFYSLVKYKREAAGE